MNTKLNAQQRAVVDLLKTGDFSIHYHDNGTCSVYQGRFDYEDFMDEEGNDLNPGKEIYHTGDQDGYLPEIVQLLTIALGGKSGTA